MTDGCQPGLLERTRRRRAKWLFQFPDEWLNRPVGELRAEYGMVVLLPNELDRGPLIQWSGQY